MWPATVFDPKVTVPIALPPTSELRLAVAPAWYVLPLAVVTSLPLTHLADTVSAPPEAPWNVPDPAAALPENS